MLLSRVKSGFFLPRRADVYEISSRLIARETVEFKDTLEAGETKIHHYD